MIKVETKENRLFVYTPFNRNFVDDIKSRISGAKWNPNEKAWTTPMEAEETVYSILSENFGYKKDSHEVSVHIVALKTLIGNCDSVRFTGIPVVRAMGRGLGARVCEDVTHIKGWFGSGGSMKNWTSRVEEGTEFRLNNIPESTLENVNNEKWSFEIIEEKSNKDRLIEKKEALLEELALIEEQLVSME
jgi:hypothetical protein